MVVYAVDMETVPPILYDYKSYKLNPAEPVQLGHILEDEAVLI